VPQKAPPKKGDPMKLSLNHFSIRTLDLPATKNFYVSLLGLVDGPRPEFPFPGHWLYQGPTDVYANAAVHIIGIDRNDASGLKQYLGDREETQLTGSGALDHVAFFATDLAGMLDRLSKMGIEARRRDVPGLGLHQLFLDDPNGIVVELNYSFAEKQALDALATSA
jgi:catechol 2,3-dioxygenase-like lactoylglutathione lyase family enzyme